MGLRPDAIAALVASRGDGAALHDDARVGAWVRERRRSARLATEVIALEELEGWRRDPRSGNVHHRAGRFFSVIGVRCRRRVVREELEWDQPILEQPEVGILGILARRIGGVMHLCLQAKEEPGNLGGVQLSPTVQATFSNYTGAHGGSVPRFLEHFTDPAPERVLFARLQTEDGERFLYKSNRNMVVEAGADLPVELPEDFIWLTLRQVAALLREDDLVNACARSVLSALLLPTGHGLPEPHGNDGAPPATGASCPDGIWETLGWLDGRRASTHVQARRIGLAELRDWRFDPHGFFSHRDARSFRIVGLRVEAASREVASWCQPILESPATGVIGLLVRRGAGGPELLMEARADPGNRTTVQLGPTVRFTPASWAPRAEPGGAALLQTFLEPGDLPVLHESRQSEEGARFFREHHLHRVLLLPEGIDVPHGDGHRWLPLSHVRFLVHLGDQVDSSSRSILACLL